MTQVPDGMEVLQRELRDIFGPRLQSLIAYGLDATISSAPHQPHGHAAHPPARSMAIVESLTGDDLKRCADRAAEWHDHGLATPLILPGYELERSLDAFPLEFSAIVADHTVVAGSDPFDKMNVNAADVRRACEVQARSHLLHLREGFIETRGRADALAVLIVRSAAPFAALLASVARLQGFSSRDEAAVGRHAERTLQLPPGVLTDIVKLANVTEIASAEAVRAFPGYLDAAERLASYVDNWSAHK